jgi:hypothetical protein
MTRPALQIGKNGPIVTAKVGKNADLFPDILDLYVPDYSLVLDLTFGRGAFWKRIPPDEYTVIRNDIAGNNVDVQSNYEWTIFKPDSFDAVVFDPPYGQGSTAARTCGIAHQYRLGANKDTRTPEKIIGQYGYGAINAREVLKPEGIFIVKCQDMVNSGKQHWISEEVKAIAERYGFETIDRFVLIQEGVPIMRHDFQVHARKNHSFFWVFKKETK